jgi:hypothetical protein
MTNSTAPRNITLEIDASVQAVQVWYAEMYHAQPNLTQGVFTSITLPAAQAREFAEDLRRDGIKVWEK